MTSLQPPRWTAPAGIFRIALRDRRELSQRGNTLQLVPRETAQCVLLRVGSMEALKPQRQLWLSTGRTPGAMAAAPNPLEQQPQHSLQGELPGSFPAVRTAWHWYLEFTSGQQLCMLSPASWQGATHYLLLRRGVRGAWGAPGINQGQPNTSVQEHPSHLLPQGLTDSVCPQGKQT